MTERPKPPTTETLPNDPADTEGHSQDALDGFDTQQDLTPTPSPEEQHDQEVRFTDAEILGKSFKVRLAINEGVTATLNEHKMARAEGYNKLSTPKNKFLERRYEAAEDKYQRKLAKVGSSRWKFINNHHQNAANRAFAKRNQRFNAYNKHSDMMQGRIDSAKQYAERNNELRRKKIESYKTIKSIAEGRKELRRLRRDMRREGYSHKEVNERLGMIPQPGETPEAYTKRRSEFQQRLGRVACARETVGRETQRVERQAARARDKQAKVEAHLTNTIELTEHTKAALDKANRGLEIASHHAARTAETVQSLQADIDTMEPDDPRREVAEAKLTKAKQTWEAYAVKQEDMARRRDKLQQEYGRLSRSIDSQSQAARNQARAAKQQEASRQQHHDDTADLRSRINQEQATIDQQVAPAPERNEP